VFPILKRWRSIYLSFENNSLSVVEDVTDCCSSSSSIYPILTVFCRSAKFLVWCYLILDVVKGKILTPIYILSFENLRYSTQMPDGQCFGFKKMTYATLRDTSKSDCIVPRILSTYEPEETLLSVQNNVWYYHTLSLLPIGHSSEVFNAFTYIGRYVSSIVVCICYPFAPSPNHISSICVTNFPRLSMGSHMWSFHVVNQI